MKSRIQISVSEDNQPCIKVNYEESDDVRDLLVKKFQEGFRLNSNLAEVYFHPNGDGFMILPPSDKTIGAIKGLFKEGQSIVWSDNFYVVIPDRLVESGRDELIFTCLSEENAYSIVKILNKSVRNVGGKLIREYIEALAKDHKELFLNNPIQIPIKKEAIEKQLNPSVSVSNTTEKEKTTEEQIFYCTNCDVHFDKGKQGGKCFVCGGNTIVKIK